MVEKVDRTSLVPLALSISILVFPWRTIALVAVRRPADAPGDTVAPGPATRLPRIVPLPRRVWPLARVSVPSLRALTSSTAPEATRTFVLLAIALDPRRASPPALMVVGPV